MVLNIALVYGSLQCLLVWMICSLFDMFCFLSGGHDGAVQEGQSVGGTKHPEPQTYWQKVGELPQGMSPSGIQQRCNAENAYYLQSYFALSFFCNYLV